MPRKYDGDRARPRGRELPSGISRACASGQHGKCWSMKCRCTECGHVAPKERKS